MLKTMTKPSNRKNTLTNRSDDILSDSTPSSAAIKAAALAADREASEREPTPAGDATDPVAPPPVPAQGYEPKRMPDAHEALASIIKERVTFHRSAHAYTSPNDREARLVHLLCTTMLEEFSLIDARMEQERKKAFGG